ncbi:hypothetical protein ACFW91_39845 [Streptomyces asoensis]|uniref:hypothetical protein n=1 Tax=Streptomyces asoensis TaxID=249586 RepID=UPI00369FAFD2
MSAIPTGPIDREPRLSQDADADRETFLRDVLAAAGVELGTYDDRIVRWAGSTLEAGALAAIASWIKRAQQEAGR